MPELPEVETCRRIIERELTGRQVTSILLRLPKLFRYSIVPLELITGQVIIGARRRAKLLVVDFDNGISLAMHLKLSGQLSLHRHDGERITAGHPVPDPNGPYPHKSTHIEIHFDDDSILYISDLRQFSWYRLMPTTDIVDFVDSFGFGPEAVGPEIISVEALADRMAKHRIPVKTILLDQKVIAGLGNIYVDEALHKARIHPLQPANTLKEEQIARLHWAIPSVLEVGIEQGGAKIIHSKAYPMDGFPAVHAREGEPCPVCDTTIVKFKTGARGTYICPNCQQLIPTN